MVLWCVLMAILPWWFVLLGLVSLFFVFESFYGGLLVGFAMDMFYGTPPSFWIPFPFLLCAFLFLILLPALKRNLIFYRASRA